MSSKQCPGEPELSLLMVEGRQYRVRQLEASRHHAAASSSISAASEPYLFGGTPSPSPPTLADEVEVDDDLPIVESADDFALTIEVPAQFFGLIIGKQGKTKLNIEQVTGCRLILPSKNSTEEKITIRGPSRKAVVQAHDRLSIITVEARRKAQYTHFISIPLGIDPKIREGVAKLQNDFNKLATDKAIKGYDPSLAMAPAQVHLTIFMLKLLTRDEIKRASDLLQALSPKIYDALEGLEIMNDDASSADVLYLKVQEPNNEHRLEAVCALVLKEFENRGFVDESQARGVKLHVTLLNSRYRTQSQDGNEQRQSFDARLLLDQSARADLGTHKISSMHLSQRGVNDANGFYHCVVKINFP